MIKVGYLVSYDYKMLLTSIEQLYSHVDRIYIGIDKSGKTWSGNHFEIPESFFDEIKQFDSNGKIEFEYSNNSKKSLFITEAKPSCGCIVVKYNEKEIKKGENGKIEVFYDTQRLGKFVKIITIKTSNSDKVIVLTIKGEVVNI